MIFMDMHCHVSRSPTCNALEFLYAAFRIFSLSSDFSSLILMSLHIPFEGFLRLLYLYTLMAFTKFGDFQLYFLCTNLISPSWNPSDINSRFVPGILLIFFSTLFLSLLFRKERLYWFVFKFSDSVLPSPLCYWVHPVKCCLILYL